MLVFSFSEINKSYQRKSAAMLNSYILSDSFLTYAASLLVKVLMERRFIIILLLHHEKDSIYSSAQPNEHWGIRTEYGNSFLRP